MAYANFQVGEKFPLPIRTPGDGGLFQIDANGIMFILQLSHADVIAVEAFRTGKMELALYEHDGLLFFLYRIDGIFKDGWGDAPFSPALLKSAQLPVYEKLTDQTIHLYLVDPSLQMLLAMRSIPLEDDFFQVLQAHVLQAQKQPDAPAHFIQRVQAVWQELTPAQMRQKASAVQQVALDIRPTAGSHRSLH